MPLSPTNPQAVARYTQQIGRLATWAKGLSKAQLIAPPTGQYAGTWTIAQNIIHCLDGDLSATHRMRRIVAEDVPLLIAYDETKLAARLGYDHDDVDQACRLFDENRRFVGAWLGRLSDEDFTRIGVHNHNGKVTLAQVVKTYSDHIDAHEKTVMIKRAMLGVGS
jgi:hypothetical protein